MGHFFQQVQQVFSVFLLVHTPSLHPLKISVQPPIDDLPANRVVTLFKAVNTQLAAAAHQTETKVPCNFIDQDFHHPAVL